MPSVRLLRSWKKRLDVALTSSLAGGDPQASVPGTRQLEAVVLLGDVASLMGDLDGANKRYEQALELVSEADTRTRIENKRHRSRVAIRGGARIVFYEHGGGEDTLLFVSPLAYGLAANGKRQLFEQPRRHFEGLLLRHPSQGRRPAALAAASTLMELLNEFCARKNAARRKVSCSLCWPFALKPSRIINPLQGDISLFGVIRVASPAADSLPVYPESGHQSRTRSAFLKSAMYGRRPRCKRNLTFQRSVRVQPCIRPLNAAAMAAGPDVIR